MSAEGVSDGEGPSSAETSDGTTSKKLHKRKGSKVWRKMSWFSRRSRHSRSQPETEEDEDRKSRPVSWVSSSSSEGDLSMAAMQLRLHKPSQYPNSEIVEQHCLRPSTTRATFQRLEAAGKHLKHLDPLSSKFMWPKKKTNGPENQVSESLSRTSSMPDSVVPSKEVCHCLACCNCTTSERLNGQCPAYLQRCTSTRSLDTALGELQYSLDYYHKNKDQASSLDIANDTQCLGENQCSPVKLQPNYFSQSLLRKCKSCGKVLRQFHLPVNTSSRQLDIPSFQPSVDYCECRPVHDRGTRTYRETESQPASPLKNKVSPLEFKEKSEKITSWFREFNDEQRNLVLKQLLEGCELPQTHLLSTHLGPQLHLGCPPNCQDIISWLPTHLATYILSFLDPVSLCRASAVCRVWASLCQNQSLWQAFTYRPAWKLSVAGQRKQLLNHVLPNGQIDWKKVFAERYRLRNNWLKGRCTIRTFEGHTQGISCVQFDDTRIVSGSSDKTIKVWNIRTNSPWSVQTLVGHSGTVRCLHLDGNRLVSGSSDRCIKVWDLSTQQSWSSIACKVTMIGHQDTVRCLQVDEEKVISGSYDKTLKIWDIRTGQCSKTLRGHEAAVLCVQFDERKIVSGSCDKTIKVWSLTGACVMTLRGHQDAVTCLQFDSTRIISGSLDCNLKFWDLKTGKCENTIDWKASEGHTGVVRCLQADSWRVVSASDDKTLKVWSLDTCQRLVTLRNHTDGVTCVQFNDNFVVSGSYDKTVILRDFSCV